MKYYLGIDGGGTKTVAAVADEKGNYLFSQVGKTINFYSVGMDAARKNLAALIAEIDAVIGTDKFDNVFIGCSALDAQADDDLTGKLCGGIVNAEKIIMHSDVYIALKSVGDTPCPCVAICGTGSMAIAEDKDGNTHIAGGWGHIAGDEGSAYSIAVNAFKLCCRQCDRGENSPLLESAREFFGVDSFRKAIDIIYFQDTTKDILARFASRVGKLACEGDADAVEIIINEAKAFAETVKILPKKTDSSVLGLYGGVFVNNELFSNTFVNEMLTEYPGREIKLINTPPEESALKLAREM